jgi:hypothetical protein
MPSDNNTKETWQMTIKITHSLMRRRKSVSNSLESNVSSFMISQNFVNYFVDDGTYKCSEDAENVFAKVQRFYRYGSFMEHCEVIISGLVGIVDKKSKKLLSGGALDLRSWRDGFR